ncbi:hypothetical protein QCA50_003750 [Cerrena zonata]|uniref:Uncharacterized protein n=1 Tax=Cerrena zonata TaxID=2478898 RepID=A0AAW0GRE4_9APHY
MEWIFECRHTYNEFFICKWGLVVRYCLLLSLAITKGPGVPSPASILIPHPLSERCLHLAHPPAKTSQRSEIMTMKTAMPDVLSLMTTCTPHFSKTAYHYVEKFTPQSHTYARCLRSFRDKVRFLGARFALLRRGRARMTRCI